MYRFSFYEFVCEADDRFRFKISLFRAMSGSFLDINIPGINSDTIPISSIKTL